MYPDFNIPPAIPIGNRSNAPQVDMLNAPQYFSPVNGSGYSAFGNSQDPNQANMKMTHPFGLNWKYMLDSNVVTSGAQFLAQNSPNSMSNATKRFNQDQFSPLNYLPYTPNNSRQDYYGTPNVMKKGGTNWKGMAMCEDGGSIGDIDGIQEPDMSTFIYADDEQNVVPPSTAVNEDKAANAIDRVINNKQDEEQPFDDNDVITASLDFSTRRKEYWDDKPVNVTVDKKSIELNGVHKDVLDATGEMMAKFPGLKITSGIRSWGDKDAHPVGRAIDISGDEKTLDEAHKYYSDVIVPKYGFNPALAENHGTGPHIHVGYYKDGGSIHIKPSHEGDFTEYKKRTGKTTEEALHSDDPHVRQMANFARNASKWKHEDGGPVDSTKTVPMNYFAFKPDDGAAMVVNLNSGGHSMDPSNKPVNTYNYKSANGSQGIITEQQLADYKNRYNFDPKVRKVMDGNNVYGNVSLFDLPALGKFDDGGDVDSEGPRKPIITNNPNDPILKAYQDSMNVYNSGVQKDLALRQSGKYYPNPEHPSDMTENTAKGNIKPITQNIYTELTSPFSSFKKWNDSIKGGGRGDATWDGNAVDVYKKPVQPVILQPWQKLDGQTQDTPYDKPQVNQAPQSISGQPINLQSMAGDYSATSMQPGYLNQDTKNFANKEQWFNFIEAMKSMNMGPNSTSQEGNTGTASFNKFEEGGTYNLTKRQIKELIAQGYEIDY